MNVIKILGKSLIPFVLLPLAMPAASQETNPNAISGLRFDPVEMHYGNPSQAELVPRESLGDMPVPILDDSGDGFVMILLPDGSHGWVNRADVKIGDVEFEAVCAQFRVYSARSDQQGAHLRGISRECSE